MTRAWQGSAVAAVAAVAIACVPPVPDVQTATYAIYSVILDSLFANRDSPLPLYHETRPAPIESYESLGVARIGAVDPRVSSALWTRFVTTNERRVALCARCLRTRVPVAMVATMPSVL